MGKTSLRKENNVPLTREEMKKELYRLAYENAVRGRIKGILNDNNLTEYKLAQIAGISRTTLNDILNGNVRNITLSIIFKICNAVNLPLSVFLYGLEDEITQSFKNSMK